MSGDPTSESVSPAKVIERLAAAVPEECRGNIVVIGSLAAGYRYFGHDENLLVQTKDVDCLLHPFVEAVEAGETITEVLMANGWKYAPTEEFPTPGDDSTPDDALPVVRLHPPGETSWFVELLTAGEKEGDFGRGFVPLKTSHGRFGLCAFGGIRLTQWNPIATDAGISIARPEMMALSNLLHHKKIGDERMSKPFGGRSIKRSNKDLGRVLALAYLAERDKEDVLLEWPEAWENALREFFPSIWQGMARDVGAGLRALLGNNNELEEAHHTCQHGLVAALAPRLGSLRAAGRRLLADAIEPLESKARGASTNEKVSGESEGGR